MHLAVNRCFISRWNSSALTDNLQRDGVSIKSTGGCGAFPHGSGIYILYTKIVQDAYDWYIQNVYGMYAKCIPHFNKLLDTFWKQNLKNYASLILFCQNARYILYTNMLYAFGMHQFWPRENVHHKHYVYNLYTKFKHNVYRNNCVQMNPLFQHILTHLLCTSLLFIANNWAKALKIAG